MDRRQRLADLHLFTIVFGAGALVLATAFATVLLIDRWAS